MRQLFSSAGIKQDYTGDSVSGYQRDRHGGVLVHRLGGVLGRNVRCHLPALPCSARLPRANQAIWHLYQCSPRCSTTSTLPCHTTTFLLIRSSDTPAIVLCTLTLPYLWCVPIMHKRNQVIWHCLYYLHTPSPRTTPIEKQASMHWSTINKMIFRKWIFILLRIPYYKNIPCNCVFMFL